MNEDIKGLRVNETVLGNLGALSCKVVYCSTVCTENNEQQQQNYQQTKRWYMHIMKHNAPLTQY